MNATQLAAIIEAILYVLTEPFQKERLLEVCPEADDELLDEAVGLLNAKYADENSGVMLREIAGGLQLTTRPEQDNYIREYLKIQKRSQLSRQALQTLAIVAYEQPITTPEIREIRGADPSGVIRTLLSRKLIKIAGRKEVIGKPFMYATTKEFLEYFGLNTLDDLPKPDEFVNLIDDDEPEFDYQSNREREGFVRFEESVDEMPLKKLAEERVNDDEAE